MEQKELLAEFYKILTDITRLEILEFLRDGEERNATEIQDALKRGQSTVSQQLKILVIADLLEVRKDSRKKMFKIKYPELFKVIRSTGVFINNRARAQIEKKINHITDVDIHDTLS